MSFYDGMLRQWWCLFVWQGETSCDSLFLKTRLLSSSSGSSGSSRRSNLRKELKEMETIITSLRDVVRDVKFLVGDLIWIIWDALVLFLSVDLPSPDYISGGTFGASRKGGVTVEKLIHASKPKAFCKTKQS